MQYYTAYDGKAMNFTMRSYEGSLSARQESTIKTVVGSVVYDGATAAPVVTEPGETTTAYAYTDHDSGAIFTVPDNWKEEPFTKDREYIDVKFVSTTDAASMIIYGSTDVWDEMSASEREGYTRADINNEAFTEAEISMD